jgi:hypothetical protein
MALLGLLLCMNLKRSPFWIDESAVVANAEALGHNFVNLSAKHEFTPFIWRIQRITYGFNIEPSILSYQAVVTIFMKFFGKSEFSARFPSVVSGLLLILITFLLCRRFYNEKAALFSSIILGTSIGFIFYATQALYATFTSLMVYVSLYSLINILTLNRKIDYILYPLFLFLALVSHPVAYLTIPISAVIIMYFCETNLCKLNYRNAVLSASIFFILYLPFLFFFWQSLPFFHKFSVVNSISASHTSLLFYPKIIINELSSRLFEEQIFLDASLPLSIKHVVFVVWFLFLLKLTKRSIKGDKAVVLPFVLLFLFSLYFFDSDNGSHSTIPFFLSIPAFLKCVVFVAGAIFLAKRFIKGDKNVVLPFVLLFSPLFFLSLFDFKSGRYLMVYLLPAISITLYLGIAQISKIFGKLKEKVSALILILVIFSPCFESEQIWNYKKLLFPPADNFESIKFQSDFINKYANKDDVIIATSDYIGLRYYTGKRVYGFLDPYNSDDSFMQIIKSGHRVWIVDNLPMLDLCLNIDPANKEYEAVSSMEKYGNFIHFYRNNCNVVAEHTQLIRSGLVTRVYLYQGDK